MRTLEPSLPTASALAIAGDRIAGAVGTHEDALPSPDRVDLGGRCVVPGFSDAHVHFPTWAIAQQEVRLEGVASVEEALARVRDGLSSVRVGGWLRGRGWRDAEWPTSPTKEALDEVAGHVPVALLAHDSHSLWVNSAALSWSDESSLDVDGGVVERDARGEPTGVLREEACWRFRDRHIHIPDEEYLEAMRGGLRAASREASGGPRQGRLDRRTPALAVACCGRRRSRSGSGNRCLPITSTSWPDSGCAAASATGCSGSAT